MMRSPRAVPRWLSAARGFAVLVLTSGCFTSDVPAITPGTAEDVGAKLTYRPYDAPPTHGGREVIRLLREAGRTYRLQLEETDDGVESLVVAREVRVREIGRRGEATIYAVQIDMTRLSPGFGPDERDYRYLVYFVAIDPEGQGVIAITSCRGQLDGSDPAILPVMARHGISARCPSGGTDRDVANDIGTIRIAGQPEPRVLWRFLRDLLTTVPLPWEDETGFGILDFE